MPHLWIDAAFCICKWRYYEKTADPISKIPDYKVCAVRVTKADGPPDYDHELEQYQ